MTDLKSVRMKVGEDGEKIGGITYNRRVNCRESKYDDVKQLETAIREAYVAKELKAQVLEAEAARVAAQARERLKNEMLKRSVEEAARIAEEEKRVKKSAKISYGIELQTAISSKEKERLLTIEIERKERKILEEVSKVIEETEEAQKIFEKVEFAERTKRELQIFQEFKEIRLGKEAEEFEAGREKDLNYLIEIDERIARIKKARKEQEIARETVIEIVAKSLLESLEKRVEIDAIIGDIIAEEKLFEDEIKLRKEIERNKIAREEAAAEIERHKIIIEKRKLRHAIEEEEFTAEVMRRVLEDRRVERLTVEAKRRRQIEYRKAFNEIIEERRIKRAEEMIKLEKSLHLERQRNESFRKRIKEMREILLTQHAGNVAEFIVKKALSDEERDILTRMINNFEGGESVSK